MEIKKIEQSEIWEIKDDRFESGSAIANLVFSDKNCNITLYENNIILENILLNDIEEDNEFYDIYEELGLI